MNTRENSLCDPDSFISWYYFPAQTATAWGSIIVASDSGNSWFKWLVATIIALLAAGGGIVALMNYFGDQCQNEVAQYQRELEQWDNFSPPPISGRAQTATLRALDRIDLETGLVSGVPSSDRQWDLVFGCGPNMEEYLRALEGVSWAEVGVADFQEASYRKIRDAVYVARQNPYSGYNDLFNVHKSNVPGEGYIFYIKTAEGNIAKLQIEGYEMIDNNPWVCRNMKIRYEVFPIVSDPPMPTPPERSIVCDVFS